MCGILATWNFEKEVVDNIIKKLSIRGRDGYGYFAMTSNDTFLNFKSDKNSFTHHTGVPKNAKLVLANSRAVPTTEYETGAGFDTVNQQPFENERYVVVLNGIIANDKELRQQYKIETKSNVDTAILPVLFSKIGVVQGLKELKGSFAILCYDKKQQKLYAAKNFMPLRYYVEDGKFLFVSLKEMLPDYYDSVEFNPYSCLVFDMKKEQFVKAISLYPKQRNKKVLVICSSGIDSTTTAYVYKKLGYEVTLLHFLYGQAAEKVELFSVKKIAEHLKAELIVYDAKKVFECFKDVSKLLHQTKAKQKDRMLDAESVLSYVPNRNAIFAMIAAGIAEMKHCDTVAMGLQQSDSVYPDNNSTYMDAVDNVLKYSLSWNTNIKFTAPLVHLIKHEVISLGKKIGVNYDLVCSCYYPKIKNGKVVHCGKCGCCSYRENAFKMIEGKDFIGDINIFITKYVLPYT